MRIPALICSSRVAFMPQISCHLIKQPQETSTQSFCISWATVAPAVAAGLLNNQMATENKLFTTSLKDCYLFETFHLTWIFLEAKGKLKGEDGR